MLDTFNRLKLLVLCLVFSGVLPACSKDEPSAASNATAGSGGQAAGAGGTVAAGGVAGGGAGGVAAGGGGAGGVGGDAGAATGGVGGGLELFEDPPDLLSATGLYADLATGALTPGVEAYHPQYAQWVDGATLNRWVYLPPGEQIDTTDMDNWEFPVGTRLWQEITATHAADNSALPAPVRVETRFIMRYAAGVNRWMNVSYVWNADQSDAQLAVVDPTAETIPDVNGTGHDVPSQELCEQCHAQRFDRAIGFSALQLDHDGEGVNLTTLVADGRLTAAPGGPIVIPGDAIAQAALGYMHGNCGHCHRPNTTAFFRVELLSWLTVASLTTLEETETYRTFVNQPTLTESALLSHRIFGGNPGQSEVIRRLTEIGEFQMPPIGRETVDSAGVAAIEAWIATLPPPPADAGVPSDGGADAAL